MTRTDLRGDAPKPLLIASPSEHPAEHFVTFAAPGTTSLPPERGAWARLWSKTCSLQKVMLSLMTNWCTRPLPGVLSHSPTHPSNAYSLQNTPGVQQTRGEWHLCLSPGNQTKPWAAWVLPWTPAPSGKAAVLWSLNSHTHFHRHQLVPRNPSHLGVPGEHRARG